MITLTQPPAATNWQWALFWPPLVITLLRLYEVFSFNASLHTQDSYYTRVPRRALINTIWHYAEVVIAFGTLYLTASIINGDDFQGMTTDGNIFTQPLYFSFVTITTLGYGDYSPTSTVGQCLVVLEALLGLVLLVIIIQSVMGASGVNGKAKEKTQECPGSQASRVDRQG